MGEFKFKRFSVINERSAMKVNTDGVLLGAIMTVCNSDKYLLDIGTGTGTIALMAAQRHSEAGNEKCHIDAIDIDASSAEEAGANFMRSPWSGMLRARSISFADFTPMVFNSAKGESQVNISLKFDHIFSNPPYFETELKSPDSRRREARHSESISYRDILEFSAKNLSDNGRVSLILPSETETDLCRYARMCGLFLFREVKIKTVSSKPPRRIVAEFIRKRMENPEVKELTIHEKGRYTEEYVNLTSPYYLFGSDRD